MHCVSFDEYWLHFSRVNPDNNIIIIKDSSTLNMFRELTLNEILDGKKQIKTNSNNFSEKS